jgi:hypothetical protein
MSAIGTEINFSRCPRVNSWREQRDGDRNPDSNKPDDALLFDQLAQWAPEESVRKTILVDNPATLYGFPRVG